jgi:hypothetical protein
MLDNWFSKNKVLARKSLSPQSTDSDVGSEVKVLISISRTIEIISTVWFSELGRKLRLV